MEPYYGKDEKIVFSIDKLCILGEFISVDMFYIVLNYLKNLATAKLVPIQQDFYMFSYSIENLGFVQLNRVGNKTSFRCEYNPNLITREGTDILNFLLSHLKANKKIDGYELEYIHFSRIDLAIDLYNYDIKNYTIIDTGSRKKAYFYDRNNNLETLYIGSTNSNKVIRIYNKAVEQKLEDQISDWWRFEVQLRDNYIGRYLTDTINCFKNIYVFKYQTILESDLFEKLIIEGLLHNMNYLSQMSKNTKAKYRKKIRNLELLSLDFFDSRLSAGLSDVDKYLNSIAYDRKVLAVADC